MSAVSPKYGMWIRWSNEDRAYISQCFELEGCSASGDTPLEAASELQVAIAAVVDTLAEHRSPLPPAQTVQPFSGQFRVRLPISLHAALAHRAASEGVSLNTLVATLLAAGMGRGFQSPQPHVAPARAE